MLNKFKVSLITLFLSLSPLTANADLLWPMQVGQKSVFTRTDSDVPPNSWTVTLEVMEGVTMCSENYFHVHRWNYRNYGETVDLYFRSTENADYGCTSGVECIDFQSGEVGEKWTSCGDTEVTEIMASETVTVPYGGPYMAIVSRVYNEATMSSYCYHYIVPGLGLVKEVDYRTDNPPRTLELVEIQVPEPATVSIDAQITLLEDLEVPENAEKEIDKAIKELNKAIDEFSKDKTEKAIGKIEKAVKHLMKAQDKGADTQDVIDNLVSLVKSLVDRALENAIEFAGEDNDHVVKAQEHYDKALEKLEDGEYDKAISEFKKAYKEAMKARGEWVPEAFTGMLEERIAEVQEIQTDEISPKALDHLEKAEDELNKALTEADNDNLDKALDKIKKAIKELERAMKEGADTTTIIESLLENIEDTVYQKITDAESVAGAEDKDIVKAWEKFYAALSKLEEGDYDKAIGLFKEAVKNAEKALK